MSKLKRWLEEKSFWLRIGTRLEIANDGKPIEQVIIRYKDFFFMVDIDVESGQPTGGFGWSEGTPMTHVPVRDHYTAVMRKGDE